MNRIIKVFVQEPNQERLTRRYTVIQRYPAFIILEVDDQEIEHLAKKFIIEDITDQYQLNIAGQLIDTSAPSFPSQAGQELSDRELTFSAPVPSEPSPALGEPGEFHHYLVVFSGPILQEWLDQVQQSGAELRVPYQNFTYVVNADPAAIARLNSLPFVRWTGRLPTWTRIASSLRERPSLDDRTNTLPRTHILPSTYLIEFFDPADLLLAISQVQDLGANITAQDESAGILVVELSGSEDQRAALLEALAAVHGVRSIRERAIKRTSNDLAPGLLGAAACLTSHGLGLDGAGEIIGIADTGLDSGDLHALHPDFDGRVVGLKSYPITSDYSSFVSNPDSDDGPADLDTGHGTHVAGSVVGSGLASASLTGQKRLIRGLAHQAKLYFQAIEQEMNWNNPAFYARYGRYVLAGIPLDISNLFEDAYAQGARIHSNSWGGGDPGAYDTQSEQLDRFVWQHKDFCILVAAGNDGSDADQDGQIDPGSISSPATAKNCIAIGACESRRPAFKSAAYGRWWPNDYPIPPIRDDPMANDPNQVAAFSSRGPTLDGRIKPDLVAPGTFILSTRSTRLAPNNMGWGAFPQSKLYFYNGGTSMATPLAAGAAALVRQYLRQQHHIPNPSAALVKAMLIASAKRIKSPAPRSALFDDAQGYGRINLDFILAPPDPIQVVLREVQPGLHTGEFFELTFEVLSRQAPLRIVLAYSDFPGRSLVNNLNALLRSPSGRIYAGNSTPGSLRLDNQNNMEMIQVQRPRPGIWKLSIIGANVPHGPQDFALVLRGHLQAGEV